MQDNDFIHYLNIYTVFETSIPPSVSIDILQI